jgi:hypothetical protein
MMVSIWLALAVTVGAWYVWPVRPIVGGAIGFISRGAAVRTTLVRTDH